MEEVSNKQMTNDEFIMWLKGIVDTTPFIPTKASWDLICDELNGLRESTIKNTDEVNQDTTTRQQSI